MFLPLLGMPAELENDKSTWCDLPYFIPTPERVTE